MKMRAVVCGHCGQTRKVPKGSELRARRRRKGLTIEQVATTLGCLLTTISEAERDLHNMSTKLILALLELLEVSP